MQISVVLPYYNEEDYLPGTLRSLISQNLFSYRLILVDNASTDCSADIASGFECPPGVEFVHVSEERPGKIFALQAGLTEVETPFVATCDADTYYPRDYLSRMVSLFQAHPEASAVLAVGSKSMLARWKMRMVSSLMPKQCHTGGYAQGFRTSALKAVGGFDATRWPYVLEDHEIIHEIMEHGPLVYDPDLWCLPSDRRSDRTSVTWTLGERLRYHITPASEKRTLFHEVLGPRFEARGLRTIKLREKTWAS